MSPEVIMIWVTVAAAIAAIASAIAASKTLSMARRAAEAVVVFDLVLQEHSDYVYLVVQNIGQSPAFYITLGSQPELQTTPDPDGRRTPIRWGSFADGIGNLYPGMSRSICWANRRTVNSDLVNTRYVVSAEYYIDPSLKKSKKHRRQAGCQLAFDMLPVEDGLVTVLRNGLGGCKRSIEQLPRLQQD